MPFSVCGAPEWGLVNYGLWAKSAATCFWKENFGGTQPRQPLAFMWWQHSWVAATEVMELTKPKILLLALYGRSLPTLGPQHKLNLSSPWFLTLAMIPGQSDARIWAQPGAIEEDSSTNSTIQRGFLHLLDAKFCFPPPLIDLGPQKSRWLHI